MPTISPAFDFVKAQAANVPRVSWTGVATGDTINALPIAAQAAIAGTVQFTGTFGGATLALQVSNDGTNFVTLKDLSNTAISTGTAALFEFTTAAIYMRPSISGGSANSVNVIVSLRG